MFRLLKDRLRHRAYRHPGETLIRELHDFRAGFIQLRPEISSGDDYFKFREFFGHGAQAAVFRDRAGTIRGMFGYRMDMLQVKGHAYSVLWVEYFFVDRQFRGHPLIAFVWFKLYVAMLVRSFRSKPVVFAITFPASYLFGTSHCSRRGAYTTRGEPMSEPESSIMGFCVREYLGNDFDPATGLTLIRTIPNENPWTRLLTREQLNRLSEYESLNPHWRSSWGVPALLYPSPCRLIRASVKRALRRRR